MKHAVTGTSHNTMTFTENRHGNEILELLQKQRELERFCDIVFIVNDKQFHAHRCIVVACSPYLDSILKCRKLVKEQLAIPTSYDAFNSILSYMYSGAIQINSENLAELLKLANTLHMEQLKNYCAEYLEQYLDSSNCLAIFHLAGKHGLLHLKDLASSYIGNNLSEIIEGVEVMYLTLPKLENFLQNSCWKLKNEEIFSLVTYWVYHDVTARENSYRSLLAFVSWCEIYPEVVSKLIIGHPLFSASELCRSFILDTLDEQQLLEKPMYESLYRLKEASHQDIRNIEDSDKFLNLAISTAICELKDDHSFLSRDRNIDSLTIFNEANVDRYLKDFTWKSDIISQDIPNIGTVKDPLVDSSHNLETEQGNIEHQTVNLVIDNIKMENLSQNNQHRNPISSSEYFSNSEKSKDFDVDYCNYYSSCPNDFSLGMEDFHYPDQPSKPDNEERYINKPKLGANDQAADAVQNTTSVIQNCCHYSHENSENCPTISNKKSYMNHKYQINHPTGNCDLFLPKKVFYTSIKKSLSQSHDTFNIKTRDSSDLGPIAIPNTSKSVHFEKVDSPSFSMVEHPTNYNFSFDKKDAIQNEQGKTLEKEGQESLKDDMPFTYDGNSNINLKEYSSQSEFLSLENSQNDFPKDLTLSHSNFNEKHFQLNENIENYTNVASSNRFRFDSLNGNCLKNDLEQIHDSTTIHNNPVSNLYETSVESKKIEFNIDKSIDLTKELETDSEKNQEKRLKEASKQTMKQKVMQKYREGRQKCNSSSFSDEETLNSRNLSNSTVKNTKHEKEEKDETDVNKNAKSLFKPVPANKNKFNETKTCDVCSTTFDMKKPYFIHMKEHFEGPRHKCDYCNSSFRKIYHLLDHRLIHSNEKPLKCPNCSFTTRKNSNLKDHMTCHLDDAKPYKCTECGEKFYRKQHLAKHFTKHTKDRPFSCDTCGWTGKTKDSLLLHSRVHSGDLYSCQYSDCAYRTAKMSHLKEHMQYHTKSRPFNCDICNNSFNTNSHLLRHRRNHHSPNSCQCPHCDYTTSRNDILKMHIKRKHENLKQRNMVKTRKPQLKKKDAMMAKHNFTESYTQPLQIDGLNNQLPLFSDIAENSSSTLDSSLPQTTLNYSMAASPPSSCAFDPSGHSEDALMIVSEMEGSVRNSLSSFSHSSYLEPSIGESLVCNEANHQYSLPFKNQFPYSISNI